MCNEDYMYAVDRSDEYLAHYGIKGMRWGVRRALASGNERRLAKHYAKAQKKLAKLKKQAENADKYSRRAKRLGAAAAVTGGLAVAGPGGIGAGLQYVGRGTKKVTNAALQAISGTTLGRKALRNASSALRAGGHGGVGHQLNKIGDSISGAGAGLQTWGKSHSITRGVDKGLHSLGSSIQARNHYKPGTLPAEMKSDLGLAAWKAGDTVNKANLSNSQIARAGAAAVSAGLAGAAGYNAYKAATAKKRAAKFERAMNETFANTKYGGHPKKRNHRRG